mmetsp:Transcript_41818/g.61466  ORF Transcript_41818/g.61466 Transcript_41818/m.61466 type:complete len:109 (+) Transcript_41818:1072-1398(+)
MTHVLKLQTLDSENEGSGSDDNSKPCLRLWTFPNVWSTLLIYGDMQNDSAQIIDNMHLKDQVIFFNTTRAAVKFNFKLSWRKESLSVWLTRKTKGANAACGTRCVGRN